jgi:type IV secretion system protein VirB2
VAVAIATTGDRRNPLIERRKDTPVMKHKTLASLSVLTCILVLGAGDALASSAGMPWEGPLSRILQSLTGPVAKAVGVFAIVGLGFGIAFSEGGSGLRKALWVVLGLAISFSATSFFISFMGFSGGLAI